MPRGDKSKYTDRQKRKAQHIEEGYEQHDVSSASLEHESKTSHAPRSSGPCRNIRAPRPLRPQGSSAKTEKHKWQPKHWNGARPIV